MSKTRQGTVYNGSDISAAEETERRMEACEGATELLGLLVEDRKKRDEEIAVREKEHAEEQKKRDE